MIQKEIFIFIAVFVFLALGMHMNQWISHPIEHLYHLSSHKMPYHPLFYTAIVYAVICVIRIIIHIIMIPFRKK